jgi:hypothetical protein
VLAFDLEFVQVVTHLAEFVSAKPVIAEGDRVGVRVIAGVMRGQVEVVELVFEHSGVLRWIELCVAGAQDNAVGVGSLRSVLGDVLFGGVVAQFVAVLVVPGARLLV